jgi:hypothetical protein
MQKQFNTSLEIDLRTLKGKPFKVVADALRSGISNEHGFRANRGITDSRLACWPIVIRFSTEDNRESFVTTMETALHPKVLSAMRFRYLKPKSRTAKPYRWAANQ